MGRYIWAPSVCYTNTYKQRCTLDVIGAFCCQWTVPSGITTVTFEIWGAGGSGGTHCCCYCSMSTAGAGGGYSLVTIAVTAGNAYTICAGGSGGSALYCAASGTVTGCHGCPSYVTGTGLSNYCANGGGGGYSQYGCCEGSCVCCDGQAFGGNVNLNGGQIHNKMFMDYICSANAGGSSPFGGGQNWWVAQQCCPYFSCGNNGLFPGGGGTGSVNCCCDCCGCSGVGASGMVRVTY